MLTLKLSTTSVPPPMFIGTVFIPPVTGAVVVGEN